MPKGVPMSSAAKKKAALTRCVNKCKKSQTTSAKKKKASKRSAAKKRAGANPWIVYVKKVAAEKGLSYKDALKVASTSYVKSA